MPDMVNGSQANLHPAPSVAKGALRESEARFQALFEQSPDAIFVEDPNGTVLDVNPAGCRLHSLPRDRIVGRNVLDLVPGQARKDVIKDYEKWFTGELTYFEGVSLTADGRVIDVEIRANPIQYAGRQAVLMHVRDVTARKRLEAERAKLASRLMDIQEKERKLIGDLLSSRVTPLLQQAGNMLQALTCAKPDSSVSAGDIAAILDKARKGLQHIVIFLHPPLLEGVGLEAALGALTESVSGNGIDMTFSRIGPAIHIDSGAATCLYRALQEALTNIFRHAGATRVDVVLNTQSAEICLEVRDNGQGMADPHSAFDRGLGLIGTRERLHRYDGRLIVESRPGAGTTLRACLPLLKNATPHT